MKHRMKALAAASLLAVSSVSIADTELKTDGDKESYALGLLIGTNMARQLTVENKAAFIEALGTALDGKEGKMSLEDAQAAMMAMQQREQKEREAKAAAAKAKGDDFLKENAKRAEVKSTPSGLQYEVVTAGKGESPKATDKVEVHYRGTLIDGTEFDSSYKRGKSTTFGLNQVIKGWTEGLQLMKAGAKYRFYIPSDLAYGARGGGAKIGPHEALIFEVELITINPKEKE